MSLAASSQADTWEDFLPARDIPLEANGVLESGGWALGRLNDGGDLARVSFVYAETTTPVRLFLIDSGVSNDSGWFDGNSNLTLSASIAIRGATDPQEIVAFKHGTRMLSIIAGPETGAALGTPIELVSYDVYPDGENSNTTTSLLAQAVAEARSHQLSHPGTPGVVCIALGSAVQAVDPLLEYTIDAAVNAGLTVIVSAGNQGGYASNYIPSAYGVKSGVICVGATNQDNEILFGTNFGSAVDFYAPGENVRTLDYLSPASGTYDTMSGTSPAAGLAAAAALVELSKNPTLSPANVEESLKETIYASSVNLLQIQPPDDGDGDGVADLLEKFFGTDPENPADRPIAPIVARTDSGASLSFHVASDLFNGANPYTLTDGTTWKMLRSDDLNEWSQASGTLASGADTGGRTPLTFSTSTETHQAACFLRIEVTPAP